MINFLKSSIFIRFLYSVFLYWPLFFFSGIFKRNKRLWLITCHQGFVDNSKYFYIFYYKYLKNNYGVRLVWLAHKKEDQERLNRMGFQDVVLKKSIKGVFFSFRSKVYISPYGIDGFFEMLSKNAFLVNLWHGIGIKNMKFKGQVEPLIERVLSAPLSRLIHPSIYKKYDLFLSTSDLMTEHFSECFLMDKKSFFISEYPRCKPLLMNQEDLNVFLNKYETKETIELAEKLSFFSRVFIYMPTWRDNNPDFLSEVGIDWEDINNVLISKNYILVLKVHPSCNLKGLQSYSNIFLLDPKFDIYPMLPVTDCLITDYSSIYFDYLLTDKNIALFTFDYKEYMESCRDFAYPYEENMVGFRIDTILEFKSFFENYEEIKFNDYRLVVDSIKRRFWDSNADFTDFLEKIKREVI